MDPIVVNSRKKPVLSSPGPGYYSDAYKPLGGNVKKSRKNIMINTTSRTALLVTHQLRLPGPGFYNPETPYGSLIKPSHNIFLSGATNSNLL